MRPSSAGGMSIQSDRFALFERFGAAARRLRTTDGLAMLCLVGALAATCWTLIAQSGPITARPGLLWVGTLSIFGALVVLLGNLLVRSPALGISAGADSVERLRGMVGPNGNGARIRQRNDAATNVLERSGILLEPSQYMMVAGATVGLVAVIGFAVLGVGSAIVLGAVAIVAAVLVPRFLANRRTARFNDQLPDALMVLASGMRAGQSFPRALELLTQSSDAPISEELNRAIFETRVGRELVDALSDIATRTRSETFAWVAEAVTTNRQLGGNLAVVLETTAETVRAREKVKRKVRAVSAEGRASAAVLISLPILLTLIILQLNSSYLSPLWTDGTGRLMAFGAIGLLTAGSLWIRRLIHVEY